MLSKAHHALRRGSSSALVMGARPFTAGSNSSSGSEHGRAYSHAGWFAAAAAASAVAALLTLPPTAVCEAKTSSSATQKETAQKASEPKAYGKLTHGVMLFTRAELDSMVSEGRIVVAYMGSLYDISAFTGHPGGIGRLQMAAGHDLEVFWKIYTQHNRGHITKDVMIPYKIGEVSKEDMKAITKDTSYDGSAYAANPDPYPDLLVNTRFPYNAEARLKQLNDNWQTPAGRHFVRNHSAVPEIDVDEYTLTIEGDGVKTTTFSYEDLKNNFDKVDIHSVIQCNGNRREDFHYVDGKTPAFGPPHWVAGAIGNAKWSGVRLRDVLRASGMDVDAISLGKKKFGDKDTQVGLLGMDHDEVGNQYCCSFPFDKAIDPFGDVLIAYEMNGQPIPRSHGYPIRAIVPGHAGARNCKFLEKVTITNTPCKDYCNWKQYAVHAPDVAMRKIAEFNVHKEELMQDPAVQEMPVQSMITNPSAGDILCAAKNGAKSIYVKGIAWGGGGAGINRVDVSLDNGVNFTKAEVLPNPVEQRRRSQWSWVFFEKNIPITNEMRETILSGKAVDVVLTSKALNTAWNVQPSEMEPNWNSHGCCVNHWYRVPVTICPKVDCDMHMPDGDFGNKPSGGRFKTPFRNLDQPQEARDLEALREKEKCKDASCSTADCTCGNSCVCGTGCQSACVDQCRKKK